METPLLLSFDCGARPCFVAFRSGYCDGNVTLCQGRTSDMQSAVRSQFDVCSPRVRQVQRPECLFLFHGGARQVAEYSPRFLVHRFQGRWVKEIPATTVRQHHRQQGRENVFVHVSHDLVVRQRRLHRPSGEGCDRLVQCDNADRCPRRLGENPLGLAEDSRKLAEREIERERRPIRRLDSFN
jgi:hypothetical protein